MNGRLAGLKKRRTFYGGGRRFRHVPQAFQKNTSEGVGIFGTGYYQAILEVFCIVFYVHGNRLYTEFPFRLINFDVTKENTPRTSQKFPGANR